RRPVRDQTDAVAVLQKVMHDFKPIFGHPCRRGRSVNGIQRGHRVLDRRQQTAVRPNPGTAHANTLSLGGPFPTPLAAFDTGHAEKVSRPTTPSRSPGGGRGYAVLDAGKRGARADAAVVLSLH